MEELNGRMPPSGTHDDGATFADDDAVVTHTPADHSEVVEYREAHPLSRVFPLLYDVLGRAAGESNSLVTLSDAQGRLLWARGRPEVLRRADSIEFEEGTPAATESDHARVQIHAAERRRGRSRPWSCAAAAIHDPLTHSILGVIDIAGGSEEIPSPMTMGLV